jgi:signal transduction histidine kinase
VTPLHLLRSLKLKLGIVIVAGIFVSIAVFVAVDDILGHRRYLAAGISVAVALGVVQILARGLTAPLREMAAAAEAMARGRHGQQVTVRGHDEVAQLASAFNTMSEELEQVDRMQRELVANVAHELRTPLTSLQATLENAADGLQPLDPETLAAMQGQVSRLGRMVEQLLDLSRMEAGEMVLEPRSFAVADLLGQVSRESSLLGSRVSIETAADPPDLTLEADPERIHQVLGNLIQNAVRFSPAGGTVEMSATRSNGTVRIEVADEGPGIPASERKRVFERFHSVDASRAGGAAGLGLAISRWIVELHGGSIRAEERAPTGCRIVVDLPVASTSSPKGHK